MIHDDGKREILISRLSLKQYYTSNGKIFRRKILLTVWQQNMFSCSQWLFQKSEPRFLEDRRKVPWNWDFSLFINEQWIGEKEIPNSNMIYQWSFRIPFFRIISSCMYRKHIYLLRLMDNPFHKFCSIFVC